MSNKTPRGSGRNESESLTDFPESPESCITMSVITHSKK